MQVMKRDRTTLPQPSEKAWLFRLSPSIQFMDNFLADEFL